MNWKDVEQGIGWSRSAWCHPLKRFVKDNPNMKFGSSLEIGASENGTMLPFLLSVSDKVVIGYYGCNVEKLRSSILKFSRDTEVKHVDVRNIHGKYDVVIAKSVLGGVFRLNESSIDDVNQLVESTLKSNINEGGMLVLLDNGRSFFEEVLFKCGSRKNNWRFFCEKDFINPYQQYVFGFFSCFSFESRFGVLGRAIDSLVYFLDIFLSKLTKHPTVILTIYKK